MALLTSCGSLDEAQFYQGILGQHQIDCHLENASMVGTAWTNAVGGVKVFVSSGMLEEAIQLIAEKQPDSELAVNLGRVTFECEECGKQISFGGDRRGCVEVCPKCHEYVDVPE